MHAWEEELEFILGVDNHKVVLYLFILKVTRTYLPLLLFWYFLYIIYLFIYSFFHPLSLLFLNLIGIFTS